MLQKLHLCYRKFVFPRFRDLVQPVSILHNRPKYFRYCESYASTFSFRKILPKDLSQGPLVSIKVQSPFFGDHRTEEISTYLRYHCKSLLPRGFLIFALFCVFVASTAEILRKFPLSKVSFNFCTSLENSVINNPCVI